MEIVDLTYPVEEGMLTYDAPWHPQVAVTRMGTHADVGRETRRLTLGTHTGTHIDAPAHFVADGMGIDEVDLSVLVGPVTIVDMTRLPEGAVVTPETLADVEPAERMVFRFGWGKHWGGADFYGNYPHFSLEAAEWLVQGGTRLVGLDTPSPDPARRPEGAALGGATDSPVHKYLLGRGVVLMEYVANLDGVADLHGWTLIALPLKVSGGDGAPARVCLVRHEGAGR